MRNEYISHKETQYGLHVSHIHAPHHAGDRHERDARERCPNHPNGNDIPRGLPVPQEKGLVARIPAPCEPSYTQQDAEIEYDDEQDDITVHGLGFLGLQGTIDEVSDEQHVHHNAQHFCHLPACPFGIKHIYSGKTKCGTHYAH